MVLKFCTPIVFEVRKLKMMLKNHTCEEGGANLRISFWHLLTNLKNKYLFKNLLKWANKKQNNLNIYNVALKKKHLEISLFYTCVPKVLMILSTVPEI